VSPAHILRCSTGQFTDKLGSFTRELETGTSVSNQEYKAYILEVCFDESFHCLKLKSFR
jgi:hypothetical protein